MATALHRDLPESELHDPKGKGAASGVAELDADGFVPDSQLRGGPFGEDFQTIVDETQSTTTSGTSQQKLRLSFTPPEAGNYLILWNYNIQHSNTTLTEATRAQVELDDTTLLAANTWPYPAPQNYGGMWYGALTASAHTVDIDYRVLGGVGTASIEDARIVAFRVG